MTDIDKLIERLESPTLLANMYDVNKALLEAAQALRFLRDDNSACHAARKMIVQGLEDAQSRIEVLEGVIQEGKFGLTAIAGWSMQGPSKWPVKYAELTIKEMNKALAEKGDSKDI